MQIINCTSHTINVLIDGKTISFEPSGQIPRVEVVQTPCTNINGIPVDIRKNGNVVGLPEFDPNDNTVFIVSSLVLSASNRPDLVAPDTGATAIRVDGRIQAVTRFVKN